MKYKNTENASSSFKILNLFFCNYLVKDLKEFMSQCWSLDYRWSGTALKPSDSRGNFLDNACFIGFLPFPDSLLSTYQCVLDHLLNKVLAFESLSQDQINANKNNKSK